MRRPLMVTLALSLVALVALPLLVAAQDREATVRIEPSRVDLLGDTGAQAVRVVVTGGKAGVLSLRLVELEVRPDGTISEVESGTAEPSLAAALTIEPSSFVYDPAGGDLAFTATVALTNGPVEFPVAGRLVANLGTGAVGGDQQARAYVPVVAVPTARTQGRLPDGTFALSFDDMHLDPQAFTIVDQLLPDIPGIVGHGPLSSTVSGTNVGTAAIDAGVSWTYHRIGLLDLFRGERQPTLSVGQGSQLVVPGQSFSQTGSSQVTFDTGPMDAMPLIGFVRVTATVGGRLDRVEAASISASRTVLVLPWPELLVALFGFALYRRYFGMQIDLRYSNEPMPIEPGAHRKVGLWKRVGGEAFDRLVGAGRGKRRAGALGGDRGARVERPRRRAH